jgi:hypothetical protein
MSTCTLLDGAAATQSTVQADDGRIFLVNGDVRVTAGPSSTPFAIGSQVVRVVGGPMLTMYDAAVNDKDHDGTRPVVLSFYHEDPVYVEMILSILHYNYRTLPPRLSGSGLLALAIHAKKLGLVEQTKVAVVYNQWLSHFPEASSTDLVSAFTAAYILQVDDAFHMLSAKLLLRHAGPFTLLYQGTIAHHLPPVAVCEFHAFVYVAAFLTTGTGQLEYHRMLAASGLYTELNCGPGLDRDEDTHADCEQLQEERDRLCIEVGHKLRERRALSEVIDCFEQMPTSCSHGHLHPRFLVVYLHDIVKEHAISAVDVRNQHAEVTRSLDP